MPQAAETMADVPILPAVDDCAAWTVVSDAAADIRKDTGGRHDQALRDACDPDRVAHVSAWPSLADARRFFQSLPWVRLRAEAGVHAPECLRPHTTAEDHP